MHLIPPFSVPKEEKSHLYNEALRSITKHHYRNCLKYRNILANGVVILYDKKVLNLVSEYDLFCGDNNIDGDDKIIFFDGGDDIIQDLRSIVYER